MRSKRASELFIWLNRLEMATPIITTCSLVNKANYPVTLQASGSRGAPGWINIDCTTEFPHIYKMIGSFMYDLENTIKLLMYYFPQISLHYSQATFSQQNQGVAISDITGLSRTATALAFPICSNM
ncbi:hypothetical protein V6N13_092179 [Hibiscus sabdariffa]